AGDCDRRADGFFGFLDRLSYALRRIVDIGLVEKANLLIESLEAGFDDLLDHVRRLAGVLPHEHRALALNRRRIDAGRIERDGACGRDMHRNLPPERTEL